MRSSNAITWSPMVCVLSWPLPAMITMSPGFGEGDRVADRLGAVELHLDAAAIVVGDAGQDLPGDRRRLLGAGVVAGDHHHVGEPGGDGAHQRPLLAVTVATGAEHDDHPATGADDGTTGGDHLLETVGGVGVVDDHVDRVRRADGARRDPLEAARHRLGGGEAAHDVVGGHAQCRRGGGRGQHVHHVERSTERRHQPHVTADERRPPGEGHGRRPDIGFVDVGHRERHDLDRRGVGEAAAVGIVDVHHADDGPFRLEQHRLGLEVRLDGAVQVEVITPEVGEHGRVEAGAVDAVQGQGVRRHLHHHRTGAVVAHRRQSRLQLGGFGRRVRARQRADDTGGIAGGPQDRREQPAGGGLAVGAGDPDEAQRRRRVAVHRGGDRAERHARVVDDELVDVGAHLVLGERVIDQQRRRPGGHGRRGEGVAVVVGAAQAGVHAALAHRPGVVGDRGHARRGVADDCRLGRARAAGDEPIPQLGDRRRRASHAALLAAHPSHPVEPAGGWMLISFMMVGTIWLNTGAAACPPDVPVGGSSIDTSTVTCGSSVGKKPTKLV